MVLSQEEIIAFGRSNGYHGRYIYERHHDVARVIDRLIQTSHARSLLNIGCGLGIMEQFLKTHINLIGIDLDQNAIILAERLSRENHRESYAYEHGDIYTFRSDKQFDIVVASEVIEHLPDDAGALEAIRLFLSSTSYLILTVPNKWQPRNRLRKMVGLPLVTMDKTHLREYAFTDIDALCQHAGLRIVEWAPSVLYFPAERLLRYILAPQHRLRKKILRVFPTLASHFIFVLCKDTAHLRPMKSQ